jgi:uncharacterized membrane protein YphA (DoxX/SURF4 family)
MFRWCLGGIFLYAGYTKVCDPHGFAQAIYNYRLLAGWMISPLAILLPWVEILVGLNLLSGIWTSGAGLLASVMLGIFGSALAISLARGLDIACGCFTTTTASEAITWLHLLRDLVLMGMAIHVLLFDRGMASVERLIRPVASSRARHP